MPNKGVNILDAVNGIKELVRLGSLDKAIDIFLEITKNDGDFHNQAISLSARINKLNEAKTKGILEFDKICITTNKITDDFLNAIDAYIKTRENKVEENNTKAEIGKQKEYIGNGVFFDRDSSEYEVRETPTNFFSYRFAEAFPGIRELIWFNDPEIAIKRLDILLKQPTHFKKGNGYGVMTDPVWWFRGLSEMPIYKFKTLSAAKCLINDMELKINKLAAFYSQYNNRCFVYLESSAESPIGLYDYNHQESISEENDSFWGLDYYKLSHETYALFNNYPIKYEEYVDGATVINDEVINLEGKAEQRTRLLSKYNFIIAAKTSPYNSREFGANTNKHLNRILQGRDTLEEFVKVSKKYPRHRNDL